ncbi:DUF3309 family protein [Aureimonas leprariae]|uniref:DUF3309 family protein n=1 Tax=Plantimonas leprariae TaxID=2615207 RepID=UPI001386A596|nr:hypothetical protein [Aureimonas leprariae]
MTLSFSVFAFALMLALVVASAPVWPWSRRLGPRPMLVAGLCLLVYALLAVWTAGA